MRLKPATTVICWVLMLLGSTCWAQVTDSHQWLIGSKNQNFIKLIQRHGLAPEKLGRKDIYLIVRVGASFAQVVVAADSRESAKGLAEDLRRGMGVTEASYSQEDDYAAAEANISNAQIFSRERSWDFDLGSVVRILESDGSKVFGGVSVAKDANSSIATAEITHSSSTCTYPLEPLIRSPIHLQARMVLGMWILPFVVVFGPLTALIVGFALAVWVAKRKGIELTRRRALYKALAIYPMFGAIGLCLPISLFAIFSGTLVPIADLWFGTSNVGIAFLPIIFLSLPLPMLLLIPMSRVETRLFSDQADKVGFQPSKVVPLTPRPKLALVSIMVACIAVGFAMTLYASYLPKQQNSRTFIRIIGTIVMYGGIPLAGFITSRFTGSKLRTQEHDPLVDRVLRIGDVTRCYVGGVDVIEPCDQSQRVSIVPYNGRLWITRTAINQVSDEALDFGIAYALLGKPFRTVLPVMVAVFPLAGFMAFIVMPWVRATVPIEMRGPAMFVTIFSQAFLVFPFMLWFMKKESKRQIRVALSAVPNRAAAEEWLEESLASPMASVSLKRHEKLKLRVLMQLDEVSKEMGLG